MVQENNIGVAYKIHVSPVQSHQDRPEQASGESVLSLHALPCLRSLWSGYLSKVTRTQKRSRSVCEATPVQLFPAPVINLVH